MKSKSESRWPRVLRGRRGRVLLAVVTTLVVLGVPLAIASHQFTDVPTAYPFHTQISAIGSAGITGGAVCTPPGTPPTYCPAEFVRRDAMAAFLQRGLGRSDIDVNASPPAIPSAALVQLNFDDITVGGVGGQQFIRAEAWLTTDDGPFTGGFCELYGHLVLDEGLASQQISEFVSESMDSDQNSNVDSQLHISWLFPAVSSGTHTVRWKAGKNSGCATADGSVALFNSVLMLQTFAFNDDADGGVGVEPAPRNSDRPD